MRVFKEKEGLGGIIERDQTLLDEADRIRKELLINRDITLDAIDDCIKAHILALEKRRVILQKQVKELSESRLGEIDEKIRLLKLHMDGCKEAVVFSDKVLDLDNEFLEYSSSVLHRLTDLRSAPFVRCLTSPVIYLYTEKSSESPYSLPYILNLGRVCDGRPRKMFGGPPSQKEIDEDADLWKDLFHEKFPGEVEWKWNNPEEVSVEKAVVSKSVSEDESEISDSSTEE